MPVCILQAFKLDMGPVMGKGLNIQWQRLMGGAESPCRLCEKYHQCASQETACEQFQNYIETGEVELILPREPTKEIFMEIYYEEEIKGEL